MGKCNITEAAVMTIGLQARKCSYGATIKFADDQGLGLETGCECACNRLSHYPNTAARATLGFWRIGVQG